MKKRNQHIIVSVIGLIVAAGLLVYYLTRKDLWKLPVHIGFAGLIGLLIWRLIQGIRRSKEKE